MKAEVLIVCNYKKKQKNISGPKLATVDVSEGAAGSPQLQEAFPLKVLSCAASNKMRFLEILRCFRDVLGVPKKVTKRKKSKTKLNAVGL